MERDTITTTGRTQSAILDDIRATAEYLRKTWRFHTGESSGISYRLDRLYEELRAARCRDDHPVVEPRKLVQGLFLDGRRNGSRA